jgi:hypothetical protein
MPPIKLPNRKTEVTVPLSDADRAQAGIELAHLLEDYAAAEQRQKDLKDQMKAQLGEIDSKIQSQRIKVTRGQELRTIDVLVTLYPEGVDGGDQPVVQEARADTGAIINTRAPYPDEIQGPLPEKEIGTAAEYGMKIAGETGVAQVSAGEGWEEMTSETDRKNAEDAARKEQEPPPPPEKKQRGRKRKVQ